MRRPLLMLLLASCAGTQPSPRVEDLVGDPGTIRGAKKITAYRIDGKRAKSAAAKLHGYPVLAGPVAVDAKSRDELAGVLLDDDTYLWDIAKACEFLPGVLLRYEGNATVDVLLCFSCDELEVYVGKRKVGHEDFDPRRKDLVRIAKRLFPKDPAIAKLKG